MTSRTATLMPPRHRFTVDEYHQMIETGIIRETPRIELIEGEIIEMGAIGGRHVAGVYRLNNWYVPRVTGRAIVSVQSPVRLSRYSEPEPDIALLRPRADYYADAIPAPGDVFLIIEVADTSLPYDRGIKLNLYAQAGIPEVWVADVERRRVFVYRRPVDGAYQDTTTVTRGTLTPLAFSDLSIRIEEIFG